MVNKMRRVIIVAVLLFVVASLPGCGDLNATYDDNAAIASSGDSSSARASTSIIIGHSLSVTATMTGSRTIWSYNALSDVDITVSYSLSVTDGGKAKLVLITPDDEVITLVENADKTQTGDLQSKTVSLQAGKNRIKIVGYDSPRFDLKLSVEEGVLDW